MMKSTFFAALALCAVAGVTPANATLLHNYELNGNFTDSLGGPDITSLGGTIGPNGYTFGRNEGLKLDGLNLAADGKYDIEIGFAFDNLDSWRKIIDFSELNSDVGLYALGSTLNFFTEASGPLGTFAPGQMANLLLSRDAAGKVTGSVNGVQQFAFMDTQSKAIANVLYFFVDDFATRQGESSSGYVDYIRISGTASVTAVPLPAALPLFAAGLAGLGAVSRRRKAKRNA